MQINYLSAPAGAGKTHALVTEINRLIQDGERVILCQPTIRLIDETKISLRERFPTIDPMVIHGYGAVGQIMTYLKSPFPEPHVLIITWEAFQRLEFIQNRSTWHLIVDEIPQAFDCFDEVLPEGHGLITSYLKTEPSETTSYSYLLPFDRNSIRQIAENKEQDKVWELFKPLAARLESKDWQKYVQTEPYQKLCEDRSDGKRLTVFSFLNPSIFDGFGSVMIAGACFEDSILYKSFSKRGVTFKEAEHLKSEFRYQTHNGDGVTICYAIDQHWSKRLRDKDDKAVWSRMVDGVKGHFAVGLFVWSANKDIKDDDLFGAKAASMRLPQSPHGLNTFSAVDNVVFLSAYNLIPAHAKFIESHLKMNREEIQTAVHRQQVYQGVMRSSMRNPSNRRRKFVFVPDLQTAQWLYHMLPGSTLHFLDFNLGLKPSFRGRKRLHGSNSEKTKVCRERGKERVAAHMDFLISNESGPHLHQNMCNENTINSRNNVTLPRVSVFRNKTSKEAFKVIDSLLLNDFEQLLKNLNKETYNDKGQNRLVSPSYFDPNKSELHSRGNDNFVTANSIWLDFDGGDLKPERFAELFPKLRMVIYNTYSSTKEDLRFRVFIPASTEMPMDVYRDITDHILKRINDAGYILGKRIAGDHRKAHGLDTGKMGPSSLFYLPCQSEDRSGKYFKVFKKKERKPLDVEQWIETIDLMKPEYEWESTNEFIPASQASTDRNDDRINAARMIWRDQRFIKGAGNQGFFDFARELYNAGCTDDEARQILREESSYARNPDQRRAEIDRLIQRLWYTLPFTPANAGNVEHLYK